MKEKQTILSEKSKTSPEKSGAEVTKTTQVKISAQKAESIQDYRQAEDAAMKVMMQYFADEMLPVFGISQKVKALAPTETVHVDIRKGLQDFNLVLEDNSIAHFEFQSSYTATNDLRRFRAYEADISYQQHCAVTTYVLFSGTVRRPTLRLTEGINTYKIQSVIMKKQNADRILSKLQRKVSTGQSLTRQDLVLLPMLPIMSGKSSLQDRFKGAFTLIKKAEHVPKRDRDQIEAAVYAMATKFLDNQDLKQITEVVKMTYLGQLLFDDGFAEGREKGRSEGRTEGRVEGRVEGRWEYFKILVAKGVSRGDSVSKMASDLDSSEAMVIKAIDENEKEQARESENTHEPVIV